MKAVRNTGVSEVQETTSTYEHSVLDSARHAGENFSRTNSMDQVCAHGDSRVS